MSDQRKDGGPAFPRTGHHMRDDIDPETWIMGNEGMSLRDFFATIIMAGMSTNDHCPPTVPDTLGMAQEAYSRADAMLKAREQ